MGFPNGQELGVVLHGNLVDLPNRSHAVAVVPPLVGEIEVLRPTPFLPGPNGFHLRAEDDKLARGSASRDNARWDRQSLSERLPKINSRRHIHYLRDVKVATALPKVDIGELFFFVMSVLEGPNDGPSIAQDLLENAPIGLPPYVFVDELDIADSPALLSKLKELEGLSF